MTIGETGERITIQFWYFHAVYQIENIEFSDGGLSAIPDSQNGFVASFGMDPTGEYKNAV